MKAKNELALKYREAVAIAELLETLEGMGGAIDEEFTKEAQRAGKIAKRIREAIPRQNGISSKEREFTGFYDDNGDMIYVGDHLRSKWSYDVIVIKVREKEYYGKLVCGPSDSCRDIPYDLNSGEGYIIIPGKR